MFYTVDKKTISQLTTKLNNPENNFQKQIFKLGFLTMN